ncbi:MULTISPECIES: hypothetical protein [unclassified Streptomyces]|uniref:hypothetical protein n=1 Tax=Streptomyces sp. NPDC127532 TaxID=3345399 RepID=UPI00363D9745
MTIDPATSSALERDILLLEQPGPRTESALRNPVAQADRPADPAEPPAEGADSTRFRARRALRAYGHAAPANREALDTVWQEQSGGPVPAWLPLPEATLKTVAAWLLSATWADSYAYWTDHAGTLSSPDAPVALAEYALVSPDSARQHEALRERILAEGADVVFPRPMLDDQLAEWLRCSGWKESQQYLRDHPDLLRTTAPPSAPLTHDALLHVSRSDGITAAYRLLRDREALQSYPRRALDAGDANSLLHAAGIEGEVFGDRLSSFAHAQVGMILAGATDGITPEEPVDLAAAAPEEVRGRLVREISALSVRHADRSPDLWLRLVRAPVEAG